MTAIFRATQMLLKNWLSSLQTLAVRWYILIRLFSNTKLAKNSL